jgi:hypothetical protein
MPVGYQRGRKKMATKLYGNRKACLRFCKAPVGHNTLCKSISRTLKIILLGTLKISIFPHGIFKMNLVI